VEKPIKHTHSQRHSWDDSKSETMDGAPSDNKPREMYDERNNSWRAVFASFAASHSEVQLMRVVSRDGWNDMRTACFQRYEIFRIRFRVGWW